MNELFLIAIIAYVLILNSMFVAFVLESFYAR